MRDEGVSLRVKRIYQKDLTPDCWSVQFWGLPYCRTCDYLATEDCGGQSIRKKILNGDYPVNGLPDVGDYVVLMRRKTEKKIELKESYFDGFEYKGYRVRMKLAIDGKEEYKPLILNNLQDVYEVFKNLHESDRGKFYAIHLDAKNKVIGVDMVSQGPLDFSPVHPREAYKSALLASASSVILVHFHPSGDPDPSESNRKITQQLKEIGELLGIEVLDHVIVGRGEFYSFADKGELGPTLNIPVKEEKR